MDIVHADAKGRNRLYWSYVCFHYTGGQRVQPVSRDTHLFSLRLRSASSPEGRHSLVTPLSATWRRMMISITSVIPKNDFTRCYRTSSVRRVLVLCARFDDPTIRPNET